MPLSKNDIIVFLGPSLPRQLANDLLLADYRGPAGQGDIYKAIQKHPKVIVLIDGVFENQPAVWHKEILFALSKGIHVFGASSMGALRASELHTYGMQGVGWVFESLVKQTLTDDDEVTITHAPEALGFQPTSEAMVNIRCSLLHAEQAGVISAAQASQLIELSKSRWYPKRHWRYVFEDAQIILDVAQYQAFKNFIDQKRIDIKQQDAISVLQHISQLKQQEQLAPVPVNFDFVTTDAWQALVDYSEIQIAAEHADMQPLQQELALQGKYAQYTQQAQQAYTLQALGKPLLQHSPDAQRRALAKFTQTIRATRNGEPDLEKVHDWLSQHKLSIHAFDEIIQRQAQQIVGAEHIPPTIDQLVDVVRLNGEYQPLTQRAKHKQQLLCAVGLSNITLADTHLNQEQLLSWYFSDYRKEAPPENLEIYIASQGFTNLEAFIQTVLQEYLYLATLQENKPS